MGLDDVRNDIRELTGKKDEKTLRGAALQRRDTLSPTNILTTSGRWTV
jgi:hypothetical protein